MTEVERLCEQLKLSFTGEAWHGPALMELLDDVTQGQAAAKPVSNVHSIWELVLHVAAWERAIEGGLRGVDTRPSDEENFPQITDTSETAWQAAVEKLNAGHDKLLQTVSNLTDAQLDETVAGTENHAGYYVHGVIQHNLYHAGQIALLKKALG